MTRFGRHKRRLDRRIYRALYRLYRAVLPTGVGSAPIPPLALRRVLIAPRHAVGDLVAITPVLSYLRAVAPQARLDVLASQRNASLLAGDLRVGRVVRGDPRWFGWASLVGELRRQRYDMVVAAGHSQHVRQGVFAALVAGRWGARVTWYRPIRYWGFFTHVGRVPGFERRHIAERLLYAVQRSVTPRDADPRPLTTCPMSLPSDPAAEARVRAALGRSADGPFVAVNCWATKPDRCLAIGQAAEVLVALARRHPDLRFVLTPSPTAAGSAAAIVREVFTSAPDLDHARVVVFPPTRQLADLVALLRTAAIVLTPDTANVHIASAVGTPVVAVYTTTRPDPYKLWRPFGIPQRALAQDPAHPVSDTPPARIIDAFSSLWDEVRHRQDARARRCEPEPDVQSTLTR